MNHLEIAKNLRLYNRWRRGEDETLEQPAPADIGRWIDAAADAMEVAADAAVAQEQNAEQCVRLNRELGEARESSATYAHLLNVACSDLERKSGQLWHANWEADYIAEANREFEAMKCEMIRQVARVTAERDNYHAALIARHGGEPVALLAELDAERARVAELEAEMERNAWTISPAMAQARIEQLAARVAELEQIVAASLKAAPVGHIPTHTAERLPEIIADIATACSEHSDEREAAEARVAELGAALDYYASLSDVDLATVAIDALARAESSAPKEVLS